MESCRNPECRALRKELERLKSTGYDMLKQGGKWQSSGATHDKLKQEFMGFFDHDVYNIIDDKNFQGNEDNAREMLSIAFQDIFDSCKTKILNEMLKTLQKVVHLEDNQSLGVENEALYDAVRAYGLLLHATGLNHSKAIEILEPSSKKKCCQTLSKAVPHLGHTEINNFADKATALSWDLLTTVPPMVSAQPKCKLDKKWQEVLLDSHNSSSKSELGLVGYRKHPALPNQTECVWDQPQLKSEYQKNPTQIKSPLQPLQTPIWHGRLSPAQPLEREHQTKVYRTGNELSTHDRVSPEQFTPKHHNSQITAHPAVHEPTRQEMQHDQTIAERAKLPSHQNLVWNQLNQRNPWTMPTVKHNSGYTAPPTVNARSSQAQLCKTDTKLFNRKQRALGTGNTVNYVQHRATALQPDMHKEWKRKQKPMYSGTTDHQTARVKYYTRLDIPLRISQYPHMEAHNPAAYNFIRRQQTSKLQQYRPAPDNAVTEYFSWQ